MDTTTNHIVDTKSVTPGHRTTEFWVSALTALGNVVGALAGVIPADFAVTASAIVAGLYAIARGLAKQG